MSASRCRSSVLPMPRACTSFFTTIHHRYRGPDAYPITAYSEFMPPPRFGRKPYGTWSGLPFDEADPWGVPVSEYEEAWELRPGLERAAREIVAALMNLGRGKRVRGLD